jgi:PAS domain S-box-containing protein
MLSTANMNTILYEHLCRLTQEVVDLDGTLRSQYGLLYQRGLSLPPEVFERLYYLRVTLEGVAKRVLDEGAELAQLRALADTVKLINTSLDLDLVLREVMDTAIALTGAERGYIVLRDSKTGELRFRVARDMHREDIEEGDFSVSWTIVTEVNETGKPVVARNALLDPRYREQQSVVLHAPRSVLCVPLFFRGKQTGVMYADNHHVPDLFGEKELGLLEAFANQAAVGIENARLFDRIRRALNEIIDMKELMDDVFASIASGVITTDINDLIVTYNNAAETILGVAAQDALGQSLHTVLPMLSERFDTTLATVKSQGGQQVIEIEPVLPGRGPVTLNLKLAPLTNSGGAIYGVALVVDDLTEIKKRDATLNVVRTYLPPSLVRNIQSIDRLGLSGDEREISIVFADVRGFTSFSEHLPPEELLAIINRYLTVCTDAIQLHDGIIDKYLGDAVVGLFNTQLNPQPDHAERAVRAALSMVYDVTALHEILEPDQRLSYGVGIDTGLAMLGNVGSPSRREFTAIGAPFNFAKLLQENALPGEVMLSQSTYDRVSELFTMEPMEPRKVKPRLDFSVMYHVTGIKRHSAR